MIIILHPPLSNFTVDNAFIMNLGASSDAAVAREASLILRQDYTENKKPGPIYLSYLSFENIEIFSLKIGIIKMEF